MRSAPLRLHGSHGEAVSGRQRSSSPRRRGDAAGRAVPHFARVRSCWSAGADPVGRGEGRPHARTSPTCPGVTSPGSGCRTGSKIGSRLPRTCKAISALCRENLIGETGVEPATARSPAGTIQACGLTFGAVERRSLLRVDLSVSGLRPFAELVKWAMLRGSPVDAAANWCPRARSEFGARAFPGVPDCRH